MVKRKPAHGFAMTPLTEDLPKWAVRYQRVFSDCFIETHWLRRTASIVEKQMDMFEARYSYIKEGMYLRSFEIHKAYEDRGFKCFKDYCEKGIKKPIHWAKNTIKAAQIAWGLLLQGITELPDNVSQAIALKKSSHQMSKDTDTTAEHWKQVLQDCREMRKPLTSNLIKETITGEEVSKKFMVRFSQKVQKKLTLKAKQQGKTISQVLDEILEGYFEDDVISVDSSPAEPGS
ncbi:MAG: toxin-antitoxin system HicB family antitoxin, partial [Bacteroidota bacterium]